MLRDHDWRLRYTSTAENMIQSFYVPALKDAVQYDRTTGYFNAGALLLAARGIESLVSNKGSMRLIVGCTLERDEVEAVQKGLSLQQCVSANLLRQPVEPEDVPTEEALELLAWLVEHRFLDLRVAVPHDLAGDPTSDDSLFHIKTGVIRDAEDDRIAWTGSLNETGAGWKKNAEMISVFTSWGSEPERVSCEQDEFDRYWLNEDPFFKVLDLPEAVRQNLLKHAPRGSLPRRLQEGVDWARRVWSFIHQAPIAPNCSSQLGEATAPVDPWPHQINAFERLYSDWPPNLLLADEVGLGKTIQAGMLLRQAWLTRQAKRVLIIAPKAVLGQWQNELREKFNLNWPIYDGQKLTWYRSRTLASIGHQERIVTADKWHLEDFVIASSQLLRREDRRDELLSNARNWDVVILDEAHHARRKSAGNVQGERPNALLYLMAGIRKKTKGLILLTATPMQVHPVEVWDLLNLLGLPENWTEQAFLNFFRMIEEPNLSSDDFESLSALFRSTELAYGKPDNAFLTRVTGLPANQFKYVLKALQDTPKTPRTRLSDKDRVLALQIMKAYSPVRRLISRNTRTILRKYADSNLTSSKVAERKVTDRFLMMRQDERSLYEEMERYISTTYNAASENERSAIGFVMTVYRRRLASSFAALERTLQRRLENINDASNAPLFSEDDDLAEDYEFTDELPDSEAIDNASVEVALDAQDTTEEAISIARLLDKIGQLSPDSKLEALLTELQLLSDKGYRQVMVFTQFTDTLDFLREALISEEADYRVICYSGRGGEVPKGDGLWQSCSRPDAILRFRRREADIFLCTDSAAEGLNFQFCGAIINYDMPWNPMRVEQRIGRIDRLGQDFDQIQVLNFHYEDTVETDVYRALRERIDLFESVVGKLQPILSRMQSTIATQTLAETSEGTRSAIRIVEAIEKEQNTFDIDEVTVSELSVPDRPASPIEMLDLKRVVNSEKLLPDGFDAQTNMGPKEVGLIRPGMSERIRVTTDADYFEENPESVEFWSPGSPIFPMSNEPLQISILEKDEKLQDILDRVG